MSDVCNAANMGGTARHALLWFLQMSCSVITVSYDLSAPQATALGTIVTFMCPSLALGAIRLLQMQLQASFTFTTTR